MRRALLIGLRIALGAVFLYAAYVKLREPWLVFAMSIDAYGMLPEPAVLAAARALPWCELALGVLLVTGFGLRWVALAAAALLGTFFTAMVIAYARGLAIDCACFGPGDRIGPATLARDGTLLAGAIALAFLAGRSNYFTASHARNSPSGSTSSQ